ncbi:MAG: dicarboxylate/amino acid:cation symporter [Planctomycetales bacterium]|nr:dicarboxylate/amino acid:cation symporter [Planctomycetales bacterium]
MMRLALHWQILIAMLLGAGVGVALNVAAGKYRMDEPLAIANGGAQLYGMSAPAEIHAGSVWVEDSPNQILIQIHRADVPSDQSVRRVVVRGTQKAPRENWPALPVGVSQVGAPRVVESLRGLLAKDPEAYVLFQLHGRAPARRVGDVSTALGGLFLRLLKMVAVPLIVASLLTGVVGLGRAERLGKMFGRTLAYYVATSMLAIITGLVMVNMIQPGARAEQFDEPAAAEHSGPMGKGLGAVLFEQLETMIPTNPIAALAEGNFLSIISFTLLIGIFTILVGGQAAKQIGNLAEAAFEVIMKMTIAIIHLAPLGVLFMMLSATAGQGIEVFRTLGWYMATVALALLCHACITMPLILKFVARRDPWEYAQAMSPALLTAFSSASSNGTLPLTMTCAEERAGVSNRVTSFVLPLGATVNMDGTALYEAVAVLFIAQYTPGVDLTLSQQIIVAITALLASIGAAGIPHAGLVMMVIILQAVGLPTEAQGLILAVDRVLDMMRTSVNVWSDSCGCAVVSRFETDEPDEAPYAGPLDS